MEPEARQNLGARGTCALLIDEHAAQDAGARAQIVAALAKRAVIVRGCTDRFEAIALAVLAEDDRFVSGAAAGSTVLILSAAQAECYGAAVHDAIVRTAPHSAVWVHDPRATPPLGAFRASRPDAENLGIVVRDSARRARVNPRQEWGATAGAPAKPQLKLSGDGPLHDPAAEETTDRDAGASGGPSPGSAPSAPLLSDEELAMLLSDEWEPGRARGQGDNP